MDIQLSHTRSRAPDWKANHCILIQDQALTVEVLKDHPYYFLEIQKAARLIDQMGLKKVTLKGEWAIEAQWAFYQGFSRPSHSGKIEFASLPPREKERLATWIELSEWVKHQVNLGPSECTPQMLTHAAEKLIRYYAKNDYTLDIQTITGKALEEQGFQGCYMVGKGSEHPPVMLSIKVYPKQSKTKEVAISLIGKGITFDSGGYVLKPRESIGTMKFDMTGAATTTAALALALFEGLTEPVELILCCAENLVSSHAYRPGDIIRYKNGVSVEVLNTDAEGRLVLADGFLKAQESKPKLIIDAATLTGAALVAVGTEFCALFAKDPDLRTRVLGYAAAAHEYLWPLPLEDWHRDAVPSLTADTANAYNSAMPGNASIAAGFLSRFVEPGQGWVHFDLSNAYHERPNSLSAGGPTAKMIRTLAQTLQKELALQC